MRDDEFAVFRSTGKLAKISSTWKFNVLQYQLYCSTTVSTVPPVATYLHLWVKIDLVILETEPISVVTSVRMALFTSLFF